uniref:Leucine rich repeat containing 8 VRAC subunit Db n=1 Tax=Petromyzon marinus TaxID=7757 RepID=S4R935_PETMA
MFTVTEVASLSDSQPAYRILKPWWDVFLDYLGIVMLMLSIFAGTMQFSRDPLCCLPKLDENVTCLSDSAIQKSLLATASPSAPTKVFETENTTTDRGTTERVPFDTDAVQRSLPLSSKRALLYCVSPNQHMCKVLDSSPSGRQTGMEYMQYIFVNQKCYHDVLPWISKYMPFLALIHTVILMASSNFWFKYPKTSSKLEHFVSILGKCFESPWTTKALSETACEESEVTGTAPQHQSKLSDHASPPKSNLGSVSASDGGSLNPSMPMFAKDQSGVSVTILDKKDGEQAKALFEKVRKFRLHVEESDIIYQLYTLQSLVKTLKILLIVGYTSYFVDQIQFLHECAPDVEELIGYTTFCCTHTLAYLLRKVLYTYMAVVVLYGLVCFYTLYWLFKRPLKEYSFEKVREESNFSDIPDVKNDFAFLMHMIDQYDSLYSKRFAVFLSEVSENKLRQLSLNHEWSYEKLRQHVTKNAQDKMELHLLMLSGVPEAVFDILDLEILKV